MTEAEVAPATTTSAFRHLVENTRILSTRIFGALAGACLFVTHPAWPEGSFVPALLRWSGLALAITALFGRLWCSLYISGYKNRKVISEGPYSMCRHPLYFFSFLGVVGVAASTETLTFPFLALVSFALYYPVIIRAEERYLRQRHGQDWADYAARVPAFFPAVSQLKEPEFYPFCPRLYHRAWRDAIWFIIAVALVHGVQSLQAAGTLPVWWRVW